MQVLEKNNLASQKESFAQLSFADIFLREKNEEVAHRPRRQSLAIGRESPQRRLTRTTFLIVSFKQHLLLLLIQKKEDVKLSA